MALWINGATKCDHISIQSMFRRDAVIDTLALARLPFDCDIATGNRT